MEYGDKVSVTVDSGLAFKLMGEIGIVLNGSNNEVKVMFPSKCSYTDDGAYWIPKNELYIVGKSEYDFSIDRIIFNGPATVILWKDWTKTVAVCSENDTCDPYVGFCIAFAKKYIGNTSKIKHLIKQNK